MPQPFIDGKGFWYDEAAAEHAVSFFENQLTHVKGELAGKKFRLEEWQKDRIIRPAFGWKRPDGTRRYRTIYVEIPRKNGKSSLAAGIALYLLICDDEPGGEVYSAAGDREQASIIFNAAKEMVQAARPLRKRTESFKRSIIYHRTGSVYKVLSADAKLKHGLNASGILIDELHVQQDRELVDTLVTSTGSRRQPMTVAITTAGYDRNSICWEYHDYAQKVAEGKIEDDSFLAVIFAAGEKDDWTKPETWHKANPNLGVSIQLDDMERECKRAQQIAGYENTFKRLRLNIWTQQSKRWMQMGLWDASADTVDRAALKGLPCYGGLDLAVTTDIAAFVLVFPIKVAAAADETEEGAEAPKDSVIYKVLPFFWIPDDNMRERVKKDRVPYDVWVRQGLVKATPGNIIDYKVIRADVKTLGEEFQIKEIAYDRYGAPEVSVDLQDEGFQVIPTGQGMVTMTGPTRELLTLTMQKRLHHGGHPVLRWMAENIVVKEDPAGNIKPNKAKSTSRIDGIVAEIMALDRAIRNGNKKGSCYEKRGLRTL